MRRYAAANCSVCNNALTACCATLGRNGAAEEDCSPADAGPAPSGAGTGSLLLLTSDGPLLGDTEWVIWPATRARIMYRSYSLPARRRASNKTTNIITPMQSRAKVAADRICQLAERKQASTVFQFQSICRCGQSNVVPIHHAIPPLEIRTDILHFAVPCIPLMLPMAVNFEAARPKSSMIVAIAMTCKVSYSLDKSYNG